MTENDIEYLVYGAILTSFPTPQVERNLYPESSLERDLGLAPREVLYIGVSLEKELRRLGLPGLSDAQIQAWRTVQDLLDTVRDMIPGRP